MTSPLLVLPVLLILHTPVQDGDPVVATWRLGNQPRTIHRSALALEVGLFYQGRKEGAEAIEHLIDIQLVRIEAADQGLAATRAEIAATWKELEEQLRMAGKSLDQELRARGATRRDWEDEIALSVAHRRLCMKALGLPGIDQVTGAMQQLWLKDARRRHSIITEAEKLPPAAVVRIDGRPLGVATLGGLLLRTMPSTEHERFARQIAAREVLDHRARMLGIAITKEDLERGVEERRRSTAADPRFTGVPFEELLKTQGHTVKTLMATPSFRANLILRRIVEREFPAQKMAERIAAERAAVLAEYGPGRRLGLVFLRAAPEPTEFITRTFEQAMAKMETLHAGIVRDGAPFERVARLHSDHTESKVRDGDAGWHHRRGGKLPNVVLAAAWQLAIRGVSEPLRAENGVWLVMVLEEEPPVSDEELIARMQKAHMERASATLLEGAELRMR